MGMKVTFSNSGTISLKGPKSATLDSRGSVDGLK